MQLSFCVCLFSPQGLYWIRAVPSHLASDYNPGSSPSGNMNLVVSMSCIQMKMLPEEAINAATLNGAYAMELGNEMGSITKGKRANLIFTKPSLLLRTCPMLLVPT
jgi:imidazolonepropionase-like amidohydrolase